jgi:hypothetical protein
MQAIDARGWFNQKLTLCFFSPFLNTPSITQLKCRHGTLFYHVLKRGCLRYTGLIVCKEGEQPLIGAVFLTSPV